jgi:hypothetical protein
VRRERQLEGIAMAKGQRVYKGDKARLDGVRVQAVPPGLSPLLVTARSSVYRLLEEVCTHRRFREVPKNALPK